MTLVRICSPHFVAGILVSRRRVIEAAPIVRYMVGWSSERVIAYCKRKHWTAKRIKETPA